MAKGLIVVESGRKARNLQGLLSSIPGSSFDGVDWTCVHTAGHLFEMRPERDAMRIDRLADGRIRVEADYRLRDPRVASNLSSVAKDASVVVLATDPDREGESIAVETLKCLRPLLAPGAAAFRVDLREVTLPGFLQAYNNPRPLDRCLVAAAEARSVLDRWIGYELSRMAGLSVGRVRSALLALLAEQEARPSSIFVLAPRITASLSATVLSSRPVPALSELLGTTPLTTFGLLRHCAAVGLGPNATMRTATSLYGDGVLSYPRTDAARISERTAREFAAAFHLAPPSPEDCERLSSIPASVPYQQGAHEGLHPAATELRLPLCTDAERTIMSLVTSAMKQALKSASDPNPRWLARGTANDGRTVEWVSQVAPRKGTTVPLYEWHDRPSIAGAVALMEKYGIGRPSTAAPTVERLMETGCCEVSEKGRLSISDKGYRTLDVLSRIAPQLITAEYTAAMERTLDAVAAGKADPQDVFRGGAELVAEAASNCAALEHEPFVPAPECATRTRADDTLKSNKKEISPCTSEPPFYPSR